MNDGFNGLLPTIMESGNVFIYNPMLDYKSILQQTMVTLQKRKPHENVYFVSAYTMALIKNDKKQIAYYERMGRIEKIKKYRSYIIEFGIKQAKVLAYLDKKYKTALWTGYMWTIVGSGLQYKGIGLKEMESVWFVIRMNENRTFKITVHANDSDGWTPDKWSPVLKDNVSASSLINIINYYLFKSKNGNL